MEGHSISEVPVVSWRVSGGRSDPSSANFGQPQIRVDETCAVGQGPPVRRQAEGAIVRFGDLKATENDRGFTPGLPTSCAIDSEDLG